LCSENLGFCAFYRLDNFSPRGTRDKVTKVTLATLSDSLDENGNSFDRNFHEVHMKDCVSLEDALDVVQRFGFPHPGGEPVLIASMPAQSATNIPPRLRYRQGLVKYNIFFSIYI
jgi:hypothetical protein